VGWPRLLRTRRPGPPPFASLPAPRLKNKGGPTSSIIHGQKSDDGAQYAERASGVWFAQPDKGPKSRRQFSFVLWFSMHTPGRRGFGRSRLIAGLIQTLLHETFFQTRTRAAEKKTWVGSV